MNKQSMQFLQRLLLTATPSGAEQAGQHLVADYARDFADRIDPDVHGNLIIAVNRQGTRKVMLSAHIDQLGFVVKYITSDGYIYIDPMKGVDDAVLLGSLVTILGHSGPIRGVFGRKPVHLQSSKEKGEVPLAEDMWIDIGAKSR